MSSKISYATLQFNIGFVRLLAGGGGGEQKEQVS